MSLELEKSQGSFQQLLNYCIAFSRGRTGVGTERIRRNRSELSRYARIFHEQCDTLTTSVRETIEKLEGGNCIILMTAHQPNLFAYSGVLRKATLISVLARKMEEVTKVPTVSFFGIADQDFTDDRWVRSTCLPDVSKRGGVLELRADLPDKLLLNKATKPSRQVLDSWKSEIDSWIEREFRSIVRYGKSFGLRFPQYNQLKKNFGDFWRIVEDAHAIAGTFSDFSAYVISEIVNHVWEYSTIFSRFSECEQIFGEEFRFLLSHFEKYSKQVKEAILAESKSGDGVFEGEYETIPFWYHCVCGGKARLTAAQHGESLLGSGQCLHCGKDYTIDLGTKDSPEVSSILSRISTRSLPMPLVFFEGLGIDCYVGGIGGKTYLDQAKHVAEHMGMHFPPIAIWRPKDVYLGIGQLDALMTFRRVSGTFDLLRYSVVRTKIKKEIAHIDRRIRKIESEKERICRSAVTKEKIVSELKSLSARQHEIRKETSYSLLSRNLGLLENAVAAMNLHPSVIDYAISIGLKATSDQWKAFLERNGDFSTNLNLRTVVDASLKGIPLGFASCDDSNRIDRA
jgi:hypothetical protein